MTEIDLFISLLDNSEVDKLLKLFNENVKSNNLKLKKVKLAKLFRTPNNKLGKNRKIMNPFEFAIYSCRESKFNNLNEIEMFDMFSNDYKNKIPNHIKFANALYYQPEITKRKLDEIVQNYNQKNNLFKDIVEFNTDDEVEKYLLKDKMCSQNIKKAIIERVTYKMDKHSKILLKELNDIVKGWTLVEYKNNFLKQLDKYPIYLIQLAYLDLHDNKTQIENGIALDMLFNYYSEKSVNSKENDIDTDENDIMIQKLNGEIQQLKNKNYKYKKENNKYKKENKKIQSTIQNLSDEKEKIIYENSKLKIAYDNLNLQNVNLEQKLNYIDAYFQCASTTIESSQVKPLFAIVHTINADVCKSFFREVVFIDANNLNDELIVENMIDINKIYIQRNGLSTESINNIENFAKINQIQTQIILPRNEKELIENIVEFKLMGEK